MSRKSILFISFLLGVILLSACKPVADMPNPASVYCEENGGTLEIRTDTETGGQIGYCIFPDDSECEEWAFYRGECKPGDSLKNAADMPNPASVYCEENGGTLEIRTDEATGGQVGICTFSDGSECDEWAFYRGECEPGDSLKNAADMPNPASVYCEENGGTLEIRTDEATGGQVGVCVFSDGSECDEWFYFRGECSMGETFPTDTIAEDGWKVYRNEELGYSFHFPPDATIVYADDPFKTLTIQGPMVEGEYWPMIFINHPYDRPEYRVPEGTGLEEWMMENNLLQAERLEDTIIAGELAIHLRQNTGEQAYPSDQYFFNRDGQLFSIVILHTGNKEDWTLYNHFLESFQFD